MEINVLVSLIFKIPREFNLINESQIHNICENIFQGDTLRSFHVNWQPRVFFTASQQISKKLLYEKRQLQLQNLVNSAEYLFILWNILWLNLITDEKFIPWYCVNTMLPWNYANTMLLWKYYVYASKKVFKIIMWKNSQ